MERSDAAALRWALTLPESRPETVSHLETFVGYVKRLVSSMKTITAETREHMKMEVPHVLIASGAIVLTRGDALTPKCRPHRPRYKTGRSKEVTAEVVRHIQHVLVMKPRCD